LCGDESDYVDILKKLTYQLIVITCCSLLLHYCYYCGEKFGREIVIEEAVLICWKVRNSWGSWQIRLDCVVVTTLYIILIQCYCLIWSLLLWPLLYCELLYCWRKLVGIYWWRLCIVLYYCGAGSLGGGLQWLLQVEIVVQGYCEK